MVHAGLVEIRGIIVASFSTGESLSIDCEVCGDYVDRLKERIVEKHDCPPDCQIEFAMFDVFNCRLSFFGEQAKGGILAGGDDDDLSLSTVRSMVLGVSPALGRCQYEAVVKILSTSPIGCPTSMTPKDQAIRQFRVLQQFDSLAEQISDYALGRYESDCGLCFDCDKFTVRPSPDVRETLSQLVGTEAVFRGLDEGLWSELDAIHSCIYRELHKACKVAESIIVSEDSVRSSPNATQEVIADIAHDAFKKCEAWALKIMPLRARLSRKASQVANGVADPPADLDSDIILAAEDRDILTALTEAEDGDAMSQQEIADASGHYRKKFRPGLSCSSKLGLSRNLSASVENT